MKNYSLRNTRARSQRGSSNATGQDREPGDKSTSLTPAGISRRRRRVIEDSDDEGQNVAPVSKKRRPVIEDSDDEEAAGTQQASEEATAGLEGQASKEAHVQPTLPPTSTSAPSVSAKGKDRAVEVEEDEFDILSDIELDEEVDCGDDEFIPGPDNGDEDVLETPITSGLPREEEDYDDDDSFAQVLRSTITGLKDWAKAKSWDEFMQMEGERPMTVGFWILLTRVSVDFLVRLYMPAIVPEVRDLFTKTSWCKEDFLSLPPGVEDDGEQGLYADFATGNIAFASDMNCDAYIGSAGNLGQRVRRHSSMARRSIDELPESERRSLHYGQICRDDVLPNFRKLAGFRIPVESGYLLLLEGIFVILFGTYNHPGYTTQWSPNSSYELVATIREPLGLPDARWRGMNAAWPVRQGFCNSTSKTASPCSNCGNMTYPRGRENTGSTRQLQDPGNPLGPYICPPCGQYRWYHGHLPDEEALAKIRERRAMIERKGYAQAREAGGADPACHCCGLLRSQVQTTEAVRPFYIHISLPGKLLCDPCFKFVGAHGRLRTPEETRIYLVAKELTILHRSGLAALCDNCGVSEDHPSCLRKHEVNEATGDVECINCKMYLRKRGVPRDPELQRDAEWRYQLNQNRENGIPVHCVHCGKTEPSNPKLPWAPAKNRQGAVCRVCKGKNLR